MKSNHPIEYTTLHNAAIAHRNALGPRARSWRFARPDCRRPVHPLCAAGRPAFGACSWAHFRTVIDHSQAAFAELLFIVHCTFGPHTTLVVSADAHAFSASEWEKLVAHGTSASGSGAVDDYSSSNQDQDQDQDQASDRTVLVSNHQTLLDWTYLWFLTLPLARSAALKIILKQTPKYVPVFGPGMLLFQFIFLSRNRARDIPQLHKEMDSLLGAPGNKWLLLFPEGTILTANTNRITREYAAKAGVAAEEVPSATLIPRSTGLAVILSRLFQLDGVRSSASLGMPFAFTRLLDVTLSFAYADPLVHRAMWTCADPKFPGDIFTPRSMYATYAPSALRIACHVSRRDPPASVEGVPEWTRDVWRDKEHRVHVMREGKSRGRRVGWWRSS
ncbi:acyltransferase-domain-containing protein [Catenaria anguillulae PL171]|uniref:Acyltransferase-domain-containing protein n=1 Tax=Catenaria anguillulae PL171 TaxID=765915 RepID=A0A1Y2H9L0_9FUNG|nr:acyltransferase-domain-containing protein [Catenaria anguillulae PL171]